MSGRVDSTVDSGGVKLHVFFPSERKVWVVVGKDDEHWVDPDLEFCSCKNFYFKTLSSKGPCYHLRSVKKAIEQGKFVTVEFEDSEYIQFIQALIEDSANKILASLSSGNSS